MRLRYLLAGLMLLPALVGSAIAAESEESLWATLKDSRDLDALLGAEPQLRDTQYGELARQRIEMLKREKEDVLRREANVDTSIKRPVVPSETTVKSPPNEPRRPPTQEARLPSPPDESTIISLTPPKVESKPPVEPPKVIAVLPPPKVDVPPTEIIDQKEIVSRIQAKLRDSGCYVGNVDGKWGTKSSEALEKFAELAKLDLKSSEPSKDALDKIAIITRRVCPLEAKPQPKEDEKPIKKAARTKDEDEKEPAKPLAKPKVSTEKEPEKRPRTAEHDNNKKAWGSWKTLSNDQLRERCSTANPIVRMSNACAKKGF